MYDVTKIVKRTPRESMLRIPESHIGIKHWNSEALHRLVLWNLRHAIEPEMLNACSKLSVVIEDSGAITWWDNGRGLPVKPVTTWTAKGGNFIYVITKFSKTGSYSKEYFETFGYLTHLGTILGNLAEKLYIETVENGDLYAVTCSRGKIVEPLRQIRETSERGTKMTFLPDATVFSDVRFDREKLSAGLREIAEKFPEVTITFEGERISDA